MLSSSFTASRRAMVESQLRTNKVTSDRVIQAFETTPREAFLPEELRGLAYIDEDLHLTKHGRFLLEPMVLARLIQALDLQGDENILHVAANCGYGTAILAQLCQSVVGVEADATLAEAASQALSVQQVDNAVVVTGMPNEGYPKEAPYDAILIEGAVAHIPQVIFDQLGGGARLVTVYRPTATAPGKAVMVQANATIGKKNGRQNGIARHTLFDAQTPILPEFAGSEAFAF